MSTSSSFSFIISSFTAVPSPFMVVPSSIVITLFVFSIDVFIVSSSSGFRNLAFITSALISSFSSISAIFFALATVFPIAIIDISEPSFIISAFPNFNSSHFSNFSFASPPLGYLITTGFFKFTANSNISSSSLKSFGAIIVKFGTSLKNAISNVPWCVSPSAPTIPALSTHIITGKF